MLTRLTANISWLAIVVLLVNVSCAKKNNPVSPSDGLPAGSIEVFPLSSGLLYHYDYYESLWQSDMGMGPMTVDSGTVDYEVMGTVGSDAATRRWVIQETSYLLHYHYYLAMGFHWPVDTSYWVETLRTDTLSESLTGLHNLTCNCLVWSFPVRDTLAPGSPSPVAAVLQPARYASDSSLVISCSLSTDAIPGSLTDSIRVRQGLGLTSRTFLSGVGMNSRQIHGITVSRRQ